MKNHDISKTEVTINGFILMKTSQVCHMKTNVFKKKKCHNVITGKGEGIFKLVKYLL